VGLIEKAMRLNPHYPDYYPSILGFAYRLIGQYKEAVVAQKRALTRNPDFLSAHTQLAVLYTRLWPFLASRRARHPLRIEELSDG